MIDCETFQRCEIDALYSEGADENERELDGEARAAMAAHAATCDDCAVRLGKLKKTRSLVLSVAIEAVPTDFESRIMAAVDAGLAKRAAAAAAAPAVGAVASPPKKPERGSNVVSLFSRPSFAVAATFVLVIGAGALLLTRGGVSMKSMAANDEAPAAVAASAAASPTLTAVPVPAENAPAALGAKAAAPMAAAPAATAMPASPPAAMAKPAAASDARAFAAAKALYNAGRYAEALPKFEALSAQNPEADLYAARCIAKTRGCGAAEARYDTAAQTNAGTEVGSRAQLEGARCYQSAGDVVAARKRYSAAKDEGLLESEASKALEELDRTGGGGGTAGAVAAPKRAPAPRAPAPTPIK